MKNINSFIIFEFPGQAVDAQHCLKVHVDILFFISRPPFYTLYYLIFAWSCKLIKILSVPFLVLSNSFLLLHIIHLVQVIYEIHRLFLFSYYEAFEGDLFFQI